jgi:lactoylglutathione lyase
MDVIHSAVWVADIDRTLAFYVDGLGLERSSEFVGGDGERNVFVAGGSGTEIQFRYDPDREVSDESGTDGFDHFAVEVADVDAEVDRLVAETGCPVRREPFDADVAGARVAFVEDPDGYVIELLEPF